MWWNRDTYGKTTEWSSTKCNKSEISIFVTLPFNWGLENWSLIRDTSLTDPETYIRCLNLFDSKNYIDILTKILLISE